MMQPKHTIMRAPAYLIAIAMIIALVVVCRADAETGTTLNDPRKPAEEDGSPATVSHTGQDTVPPDGDEANMPEPEECREDLTRDGVIDSYDLVGVLMAWGPCGADCPADVDEDGQVGVSDVVAVILKWGVCP